jgi:hypothetical protein
MIRIEACILAALLLVTGTWAALPAERATPDDTARFLAGLNPSPSSPLTTLTKSAVWQTHASRFDALFDLKDRVSLSKIHLFEHKEIPHTEQPLLYFF